MTPEQVQFLLAEFHALRAEIDSLLAFGYELPRYALLLSAVVWSWLLTRKRTEYLPQAAGLIAPLLTLLLALMGVCVGIKVNRIGNYLKNVESQLSLPPGLGWETSHRLQNYPWFVPFTEGMLWTVIVLTNVVAAIYYWKMHKLPLQPHNTEVTSDLNRHT